jgi:signal transduction histidine kinase
MTVDRARRSAARDLDGRDYVYGYRNAITWIAVSVALAVALVIPALFFLTAHRYESARIALEADLAAERVAGFVDAEPDLWKRRKSRLATLMYPGGQRTHWRLYQIFDETGVIARVGTTPRPPVISSSVDVSSGGQVVAHLRTTETMWPMLIETYWVACVGFGLAVAVFVMLRAFPLRARALRARIDELELAKSRLEQQGAELERSAQRLVAARDEAQAANRAKSEFLANMGHELRTPLNAIIGFSDLIKAGTCGPIGNAKYLDYSDEINRSGQHLLDIINNLLDLSRIQAGKQELREQTVDVGALVERCRKLLAGDVKDGGLQLDVRMPAHLPALHGDPRKVEQILRNLLSNAVEFTAPGGTITVSVTADAGHGIAVAVQDTGIGIAVEDISKALASFGQVDGSLARQHEGTGLGLPLAKALAELHGGTLVLDSEIGVGTTVRVRFPPERLIPLAPAQMAG